MSYKYHKIIILPYSRYILRITQLHSVYSENHPIAFSLKYITCYA